MIVTKVYICPKCENNNAMNLNTKHKLPTWWRCSFCNRNIPVIAWKEKK